MKTLQCANTHYFHKGELITVNGEKFLVTKVVSKTSLQIKPFTFLQAIWYDIKKFFRGY